MSTQSLKEMSKIEKAEHAKRKRLRNEQISRKNEENHWAFVAGKMVYDYLNVHLNIRVYSGKDAADKNKDSFAPLENILRFLADHEEIMMRIARSDGEN